MTYEQTTTDRMSQKPRKPKKPDRHVSKTMVRMRPQTHARLKILAAQNGRPLSWELDRIVVKVLDEAGIPDTSNQADG